VPVFVAIGSVLDLVGYALLGNPLIYGVALMIL
jgi:hypothetical protein